MSSPLQPSAIYPAGVPGVSARVVALSTGVKVRVAESGPVDGEPLVMLHGWGASLYMFRHALAMLPSYGVRAIAVDLRGYGLSDHPSGPGTYTLDAYFADVDAVLDALELPAASLLGQSMGGGLALRYALRRPERMTNLILINPTGLVPVPWVSLVGLVPRGAMEIIGERLVPRWLVAFILRNLAYADPSLVSQRDVDEYWAPTQISGYVRAVRRGIAEFDWRPVSAAEASSLTVPSVVILGTRDRVVRNAHEPAARLRGTQVHGVDGGHCAHEEHPEVVYKIVGALLAEIARRR